MKLFWKLFIYIESTLMIIFGVFGLFLIHYSYENALSREMEQSTEEVRVFKYSLLTSMESLPESYQAGDVAIEHMAETLQNNLADSNDIVKIYDSAMKTVYESIDYDSGLLVSDMDGAGGISHIVNNKNGYFLELLTEIDSTIGTYYLEIDKDISYVYQDRSNLLYNYKIILSVVFLVSLIITAMFSLRFTRPIKQLSRETKRLAKGNYEHRVAVKGNDEITDLMVSFNTMADELQKNIDTLKENARRQEDFTAAFAHELKTPLTSVIGYAEMLRSRQLSDRDITVCSDYIYQQGKRLEKLSYKLMELVGMREGTFTAQQIKVKRLTENIKNMSSKLLEEKSIKLIINVEDGIIFGDMDLLLSLFLNLIDNARKACSDGGKIEFTGTVKPNGYEFCVQDNGRGIPKDEIDKITEAFYMVDKSRARKEGGAGIGMALCQSIVKIHKAEWEITSMLGEWTKVRILFPDRYEQ